MCLEQRCVECIDSEVAAVTFEIDTATTENILVLAELKEMAALVHIGAERHGDGAGEHIRDLILQVRLERRDLQAVGVRDLGDELLRDIDDAVAEGLEALNLAEELSAYHVPALTITTIALVFDAELVEHIETAVLVEVLDEVKRDNLERVLMLLELVDYLTKLRPGQDLLGHAPLVDELVSN